MPSELRNRFPFDNISIVASVLLQIIWCFQVQYELYQKLFECQVSYEIIFNFIINFFKTFLSPSELRKINYRYSQYQMSFIKFEKKKCFFVMCTGFWNQKTLWTFPKLSKYEWLKFWSRKSDENVINFIKFDKKKCFFVMCTRF